MKSKKPWKPKRKEPNTNSIIPIYSHKKILDPNVGDFFMQLGGLFALMIGTLTSDKT